MAVIHSNWPASPKTSKTKKATEVKKEVIIPVVKEEKVVIPTKIVDDPTAEEFIATLPKKRSNKKKIVPVTEE